MLFYRRVKEPARHAKYGRAYQQEAQRILGIWRWQPGDPIDPREAAHIHRRAFEQATRTIDPGRRLGLTLFGVAELQHLQAKHLAALLAQLQISPAEYDRHEAQEQHMQARREQRRPRLPQP